MCPHKSNVIISNCIICGIEMYVRMSCIKMIKNNKKPYSHICDHYKRIYLKSFISYVLSKRGENLLCCRTGLLSF